MMNRTEKKVPMLRYVCVMSVAILMLCGMTLMLSSCVKEKPDPDRPHTGKKVDVRFVLKGGSYGANEVLTRNGADEKPETVVVRIREDLFMYATMEPDRGVELRAASNLAENTKVRIAAYPVDAGSAVAEADYKVNSSGALVYSDGNLRVTEGYTYKFVAYSFNRTDTIPAHSETIAGIDPDYDLLWESAAQLITGSNNEVEITLGHLFSRVTINVTTESLATPVNIIGLIDVTIAGIKPDLTTLSGNFDTGSSYDQEISFENFGAKTVTSKPRTVFTGNAATTEVTVGQVVFAGLAPFTLDKTAVFNKQLLKGVSYTLNVIFKNNAPSGTVDDFDVEPGY